MIRRIILPIALLSILSLLAGCGGSAGTSSEPVGVNQSQPSIVRLIAVQQVVQTNSKVFFKAKVLDGNGKPVSNVPVTFTNLSSFGTLSSTSAATDSLGFATVTLFSSDSGFSTVQAEVATGTGKLRDKRTVFFSISDLVSPLKGLTLAVDNNNDNSFDDPSDFIFFNPADPHDQAIIRATVRDASGNPVLDDTVTFGADSPEASFPDGQEKSTNAEGQAFARIKITPTELRNITVPLNVTGVSAKTGAANVITLFIGPITVNQLTVIVVSDPQTVDSGGNSTITAIVKTLTGTPVPDGTTVNFTTTKGNITPFAQTTDGLATATFTAPTIAEGGANITATITASAAGKAGTVNVTVIAPPAPVTPVVAAPESASLNCAGTASATIILSGGTPPYSIKPADGINPNALKICVGSVCSTSGTSVNVATDGGSFTVAPNTTGDAACTQVTGTSTDFSLQVKDSSSPAQTISVPITLTKSILPTP